jgi:hypothetical protein
VKAVITVAGFSGAESSHTGAGTVTVDALFLAGAEASRPVEDHLEHDAMDLLPFDRPATAVA